MYFIYALMALFTAGCVALPIWAAISLFLDEEIGMATGVGLIGWPLACLLGAGPWMYLADARSPVLATLHRNEWVCSESHVVPTTTYVQSGKVMVPVTSYSRVCDQYNRLG